mmetsp:Transcript_33773/g.85509  ORF Transcript_33773/g.85509 Transcript_33773/m.85509 type:complete len:691 (+) Transcript_33773:978-3050(+)
MPCSISRLLLCILGLEVLQLLLVGGRVLGHGGVAQLPVRHVPHLAAHGTDELLVVGDDHHAALVRVARLRQRAQSLAVQVVGGLVHDEHVRVLPHGSRQHQLDLLPARQAADVGVHRELGLQPKVAAKLLDGHHGEGARLLAHLLLRRLLAIHLVDQLLKAALNQLLTRNPPVEADRGQPLPLDLVLVGPLLLAAAQDDAQLAGLAINHPDLVAHLLPLLALHLAVHLLRLLPVLAAAVAAQDVARGRDVQVLLNVVERVLRDVRDAHVGVARHLPRARLELARQDLDERRLAGAVAAQHGDARVQAHVARDVHQRGLGRARVRERHLLHVQDRLLARRHTVERGRLGEVELEGGGRQLVVRLGLGLDLDKLGQVALVAAQAPVLVVVDVGAHIVEERRVVRHNHGGDVGLRVQILHQPRHVGGVQVVGGLVQQQDVGLQQHGARQRQLHLPASRQVGDQPALELVSKAHAGQRGLNLALRQVVQQGVGLYVGHHTQLLQRGLDVVLHVHGAHLVGGREAVDLVGRNRAHERRLADAVGAAQAVTAAALEHQARVVEQDLAAVRQRELAVGQRRALHVVLQVLLLRTGGAQRLGLLARGHGRFLRLLVRAHALQVRHQRALPVRKREVALRHVVRGQAGAVLQDGACSAQLRLALGRLLHAVAHQRERGRWLQLELGRRALHLLRLSLDA